MLSVKGKFRDGVAHPDQPVDGLNGHRVIITFWEEEADEVTPSPNDTAWDVLTQLVEDCTSETGIVDLAQQHDHYLYGKSKRR